MLTNVFPAARKRIGDGARVLGRDARVLAAPEEKLRTVQPRRAVEQILRDSTAVVGDGRRERQLAVREIRRPPAKTEAE